MTGYQERMDRVFGPRVVDVDWRSFALAMFLTPILFALSGVILLFYGVFITASAAVLGLPALIIGGIPAAIIAITRMPRNDGRASVGTLVGSGLCAHFLTAVLIVLAILAAPTETGEVAAFLPGYLMFGMIAAPIEALIFALLYRSFARDPLWRGTADVFT